MEWVIGALVLYLLLQGSSGSSLFSSPTVATPGTQLPVTGGVSLIVPGGTTYHQANGNTITVQPGALSAPGGFVLGTQSDGTTVWFNPATGQTQPYTGSLGALLSNL